MEIFDLSNVGKEELTALHNKYLEMLDYFDKFCVENNLNYFLCGGSLIGAVRHKGFIPWDDDVDIFMPRADYERLTEIWSEKNSRKNYFLARTDFEHNYHHPAMSIRDVNTTFINRHSIDEDVVHAIGIELIPIDGAPKNAILRAEQIFYAFIFALFNSQRLPENKGSVIRFLSKVIYTLVPGKKTRYKLWKYAEKKMSRYSWENTSDVTELIGSIKGMLIRHPKESFTTTIRVPFETIEVNILKDYDRYLTLIFGDYMSLPPEGERQAKHDTVYINTESSYLNYKGIYYLKNKENIDVV